jgi:hypothetical protein
MYKLLIDENVWKCFNDSDGEEEGNRFNSFQILGEDLFFPAIYCLSRSNFIHSFHQKEKGIGKIELGIFIEYLQGCKDSLVLLLFIHPY